MAHQVWAGSGLERSLHHVFVSSDQRNGQDRSLRIHANFVLLSPDHFASNH